MLKKLTALLIVVLLTRSSFGVFAVDSYGGYDIPIDIEINGSFIKCVEKPILINGTTYIPLRAFSDAISGTVGWDETENAAKMEKDGHTFVFCPEKGYCLIDGAEKDHPSVIYKDLTFIPVRAVSETLDYNVKWDGFYLTVKIEAPGVTVPEECKDTSYTYEDILYLGKIIQIECGYESFNVKLGVGGTVFNRVKSASFPNTVKDVIFDTKWGVQFPPVHTDMIERVPSAESVSAAKCVLNGVNIVGNSLYFIDTDHAASSWAHNNRPHYGDIDGMSFYE